MSGPPPDVSVVIVSWNTRDFTLACLASLPAAAASLGWEAWVVDNASADDSVAAIRREHPGTRIIANGTNLGFAAANNQGIVACRGRYVLLLNSDTVMPPGSLQSLVAFADAHPRAGVVGPTLLNPDGSYQTGPTPFPSLWTETLSVTGVGRRLTYRGYPSVSARRARAARRADYVGGACMLARREAIDAVGLLDESVLHVLGGTGLVLADATRWLGDLVHASCHGDSLRRPEHRPGARRDGGGAVPQQSALPPPPPRHLVGTEHGRGRGCGQSHPLCAQVCGWPRAPWRRPWFP